MTSNKDSADQAGATAKKAASGLTAEQAEQLSASIKPSWDRFFGDQGSGPGEDEREPPSRPDLDEANGELEDAPTEALDGDESSAPSGRAMLQMSADESRGKTIVVDELDEELPDSEDPPWPKAPPPDEAAAEQKTTALAAADDGDSLQETTSPAAATDDADPLQQTIALAAPDEAAALADGGHEASQPPKPTAVLPAASWPPEASPADSQGSEPPAAAFGSTDEAAPAAPGTAPVASAPAEASYEEPLPLPDFPEEESIRVPTTSRPWGKVLAIGAAATLLIAILWFVGTRTGGGQSESAATTDSTTQPQPQQTTAAAAPPDTAATASAEPTDEADAATEEADADSGSETTAPSAEPTTEPDATAVPSPPPPNPGTTPPPRPPPPKPTGDGIVREVPF